jgi:serine/threonine-protein kinase
MSPGDVIDDRYTIVRPIAVGGMGEVFLAEDRERGGRVAVKLLRAELARDPQMLRRFTNEAIAAGRLGHPNIVASLGGGVLQSGVPYLAFEYVDGVRLGDEIRRAGRFAPPRAIAIARQIASALAAAHAAAIVHRDLKSDNIVVDAIDHAWVLDFGISRIVDAKDRTATGSSMMLGTPEFMAPEQIIAPDTIDHRVDIYALGVVLYEMLAGTPPFPLPTPKASDPTRPKHAELDDAHALLERIVREPPPPLAIADAPAGLAELVVTLLAKDPDARPQRMDAVRRALAAI